MNEKVVKIFQPNYLGTYLTINNLLKRNSPLILKNLLEHCIFTYLGQNFPFLELSD